MTTWTVLFELVGPDAVRVDLGEIDRLIERATSDGLRGAYDRDRHTLHFAIDEETPAAALHAVLRWWRRAAQSSRTRPPLVRVEIHREADA